MVPSEIRQAVRGLLHRPAFALLAVVTLALGLGATTAIFSAFYRLAIQPLPYEELDQLVYPFRRNLDQGFSLGPDYDVMAAWQKQSRTVQAAAMWNGTERTLLGQGEATVLRGTRASVELPRVLREQLLLGRWFTEEEQASRAQVVVLSEGLWKSRFGGARDVVGRTLQFGPETWTIIGVTPGTFGLYDRYHPDADFWIPFYRENEYASVTGVMRLRADVTLAAATEELTRLAEAVGPSRFERPGRWDYQLLRVTDMHGDQTKKALPILLGAAGLVLLIACANVAGLLLVRLAAREREISIRSALGAGRTRILATLGVEQLLIAVLAGGLGLLVASWAMTLMRVSRPTELRVLETIALEPAVLAFAGVLVLLTTLLFGILPALAVLRRDPSAGMREGDARVTGGTRARAVLVTAEVAISMVLMVGAVLLIRSFDRLRGADLGFDPANRIAVELAIPPERYRDTMQIRELFTDLVGGAATIPGVQRATVGGSAPPQIGLIFGTLRIAGNPDPVQDVPYLSGTVAGPGFLPAIGARFIEGRDFTGASGDESHVIVNRAFAERFWPSESALGKRFKLGSDSDDGWETIVGVVENMRVRGARQQQHELQMFMPMSWAWGGLTIALHTDGTGMAPVIKGLRQVIQRVDPQIAVREATSIHDAMREVIARDRFITGLLVAFALMALVLTAVGLYGLVAYSVQQRTREVGIRVALGATPAMVRTLFLEHGTRLAVIGVIAGAATALAGTRVLAGLLHGVKTYDGVAFGAGVMVIATTAILASWLPARRASNVDPLVALREE